MKKILLAVTAALAITGCSQNEEFDNAAQNAEIGFSTIVSKTTRAGITKIDELQKSGFTVYAYNTGENVAGVAEATLTNPIFPADGLGVTFSAENKWTYTGTYYWPLKDKVQFFAYATDASVTGYEVTGLYPTFKYTIAAAAADQKDFVVAKALDQTKPEGELGLKFTHALTQVNFSVVGADNKTYKISSVSIKGVAASGVYSFKDDKWTPTADETTGTYTYPIATDASVSSSTDAVKLDQSNGALMLMPQAMTENAKILISYTVYDGGTLVSESTNTEVPLKDAAAWEPGKKVRYTLKLANNAVSMSFAPEVGEWSSTDDTPVNGDAK